MRSFVKQVLYFAMIPITLLCLNYWFLKNYLHQKNYEVADFYDYDFSWVENLNTQPKILLMGSSSIKYGLSPTIIAQGLNYEAGEVLNLGIAGGGPINAYYLLHGIDQEYFKNVKMVVYGIDPHIFSKRYYKFNRKLIFDFNIDELFNAYSSDRIIARDLLGVEAYWPILFGVNKDNKDSIVPSDFGGDTISVSEQEEDLESAATWFERDKYSFSEIHFYFLNKLKMEFEQAGIHFVLLNMPRKSEWYNDYFDNCADINEEFNGLMKKHLNDYCQIGSYSDIPVEHELALFYDVFHLNKNGVSYYSNLFGELIDECAHSKIENKREHL